jgi:biopolymer transport protein ExbD
MRAEVDDGYDPFDESDDLAPLLDLKFILLIALIVVLMHFAQRDLDNRFAVPAGPGSPLIAVDEQEYQRMLVVSLDAEGLLRVNGQEVFAEQLAERLQAALPTAETDTEAPSPVVFNADPAVPYGDAQRVYLRLLRDGFTVLNEYQEEQDER